MQESLPPEHSSELLADAVQSYVQEEGFLALRRHGRDGVYRGWCLDEVKIRVNIFSFPGRIRSILCQSTNSTKMPLLMTKTFEVEDDYFTYVKIE